MTAHIEAYWSIIEILHHIISEEFAVCLSGQIPLSSPLLSSTLLSSPLISPVLSPSLLPAATFLFSSLPLIYSLVSSPSVRLSVCCSLFQLPSPSRTINPSPQPIPGPRSVSTRTHTHASVHIHQIATHVYKYEAVCTHADTCSMYA